MAVCSRCGGAGISHCPFCHGSGVVGKDKCKHCHGSGGFSCVVCAGYGEIGDFKFEVRGIDANDVEKVAKSLAREGQRQMKSQNKINVHLHNSTIGILSTGEIKDVESISVNVSNLVESGHDDVAKALKELVEAIAASQEISSEQRAYLLENLEELSNQAALPAEKRAKAGVIKSILSGVASTLGAAGGLAEVWSTWGM